ncbi:hypothetical protein D3C87_183970 [compost metagenome]
MSIIDLKERPAITNDFKLNTLYFQFGKLLSELEKKNLPQDTCNFINERIERVNISSFIGNDFKKLIKQEQTAILKHVEKAHKIAPKNYYRNLWMLLGFTAFGLPIGVSFGLSIGNIGLMGVGLPIGMAIGAAVGSSMDKKALSEGRQLDIEIKY